MRLWEPPSTTRVAGTLVYVFNFVDRQTLVILQEPIKLETGPSNAQLGLLSDLCGPSLGEDALRYAMLTVVLIGSPSILVFVLAVLR